MSTKNVHVTQLSGPGVPGLETDPPLYHFDIDFSEVHNLVSDPVAFLQSIGLDQKKGIAPTGTVNVTTNFSLVWNDKEWVSREAFDKLDGPVGCCYTTDSEVICHVHVAEKAVVQ